MQAQAGLVTKFTLGLILIFLLNEALLVAWPSLAYVAIRMVVIPTVALVDSIACVVAMARRKQAVRARIVGGVCLVLASLIGAFQWLWPGAVFGALMPHV